MKPRSNPATFEQERPQKPGSKAVSTLHYIYCDLLTKKKFPNQLMCRVRISRGLAVMTMFSTFLFGTLITISISNTHESQCFFPLITIKIQCPCKNGLQQQKCKFARSVLICNWPSYFPYPYTLVQWDSAAVSQPCLSACFPPCLVDKRG